MATKTVFEVKSMKMVVQESFPPRVQVTAYGTTRTGGWTNPKLVQIIHVAPPKDGIIELNFVADEPTGGSTDAITPIESEELNLGLVPEGTRGVRVIAETNSVEELF
jgi:TRAP-type uncharacterized transport system substrate-binding protein